MTTISPTCPPSSPCPTSAPIAPPTTSSPVAPSPSGPETSSLGKIIVSACIADGTARVGLENTRFKLSQWNGVMFPFVSFDPFSTENNDYPAFSVKGELSGGNLAITVRSGSGETNFIITPGGAENCYAFRPASTSAPIGPT